MSGHGIAGRFPRRHVLVALGGALLAPGCARGLSTVPGPARAGAFRFVGGQWFDGARFVPRTVDVADGLFVERTPRVDVVDLAGLYVVPPFGDAHTHHFDNPGNLAQQVAMYLDDGVFYAKVQTDVRSRALAVADRVNRPDSVDVIYAHGGLTGSYGHPIEVYEGLALNGNPRPRADQVAAVRASRLRAGDAYHVIDTLADLDARWPAILAGRPDFIKIYLLYSEEFALRRDRPDTVGDRGLDPALAPPIVARAHAAGLRVSAHVQTAADYRAALYAGVDEMAHLPGGSIPATADPARYLLSDKDVRETARRGVWVVPAPSYYAAFDPASPAFDAAAKARTESVRIANLQRLRRHRVNIAFGSDSFGRSPLRDVVYLQSLGVFSNAEMLDIWCGDTPRTIFPNRKLGRLEEGYEASFLALGRDPLTDFGAVGDIRLRFKQGRIVGTNALVG